MTRIILGALGVVFLLFWANAVMAQTHPELGGPDNQECARVDAAVVCTTKQPVTCYETARFDKNWDVFIAFLGGEPIWQSPDYAMVVVGYRHDGEILRSEGWFVGDNDQVCLISIGERSPGDPT